MSLLEDLHFLVSNRLPRRLATQFMGWFGKIEQPLVRDVSIAAFRRVSHVDLGDARKTQFESLHDCFIRELKPGARPIDPDPRIVVSPCDAQIGQCGRIDGDQLLQAKGFPYSLADLLVDPELVERYCGANYVTLRLTPGMYHRFHAPHDLRVGRVDYVAGDTWNTNPIALRRVEKLFCRNERAVIRCTLSRGGHELVLVPIASILVASLRLHWLDHPLHLNHRGPKTFECDAEFDKGQEMGFFELGSTIIVFAPRALRLCEHVEPGALIRLGQPLLRIPP